MAEDAWEGGATTLPAPKKRLERGFAAVMTGLRVRRLRLGKTTSANMLERGVGICRVLVRTFLRAALGLVKPNTDIVGLHVGCGDAIDPRGVRLLLFAGADSSPATTAAVRLASATGALGTFLKRDWLGGVDVPGPKSLELLFDGKPGIGPFKVSHLP